MRRRKIRRGYRDCEWEEEMRRDYEERGRR